jgi:hypothetical protein
MNGTNMLILAAADDTVELSLHLDRAMNYALAHNGVSPLKVVSVDNRSGESLDALQLEIELDAPVGGTAAAPMRVSLPELEARSSQTFTPRDSIWTFHPGVFAQIDEAVAATVTARVIGNGHLLSVEGTMSLLAHNEWWALSVPEYPAPALLKLRRTGLHSVPVLTHELREFAPFEVVGRLALIGGHPIDRPFADLDFAERTAITADRDLDVDVADGNRLGDVE